MVSDCASGAYGSASSDDKPVVSRRSSDGSYGSEKSATVAMHNLKSEPTFPPNGNRIPLLQVHGAWLCYLRENSPRDIKTKGVIVHWPEWRAKTCGWVILVTHERSATYHPMLVEVVISPYELSTLRLVNPNTADEKTLPLSQAENVAVDDLLSNVKRAYDALVASNELLVSHISECIHDTSN